MRASRWCAAFGALSPYREAYRYPQSALLSSLDWGYRESAHSGLVDLPNLARFGVCRSVVIPDDEGLPFDVQSEFFLGRQE